MDVFSFLHAICDKDERYLLETKENGILRALVK
jgi:hypothetical protein